MAIIGKRNTLKVVRSAPPGVYLDGGELGEILLPNRYVPPRVRPGHPFNVFVYRDSMDRLVATTETPLATVGDVATLRVISVHQQLGAFLDWGLAKDLLLPFREQTEPVQEGQQVRVRVYLDEKSQRIVASMKLEKAAAPLPVEHRPGDKVEFVLTEKTDLGYQALLEGNHRALLYHDDIHTPVRVGQRLRGYIRAVRPDGKMDLTLNPAGYGRVAPLASRIVEALQNGGGRLEFDDDTSPEAIREAFGASKKAFKQALGTLYKTRRIRFTNPGIELLDNTSWSPGRPQRQTKPNRQTTPQRKR